MAKHTGLPLRELLLGFLKAKPAHGYSLKRRFSPALGRKGEVSDGSLYSVLNDLERKELIERTVEQNSSGQNRNVFSITDLGAERFDQWLHQSENEADEVTYDFLVTHPFLSKYLFFDSLSKAQRRSKLEEQIQASLEKLEELEEIKTKMADRKVSKRSFEIIELGITQQRAFIAWLRGLLKKEL